MSVTNRKEPMLIENRSSRRIDGYMSYLILFLLILVLGAWCWDEKLRTIFATGIEHSGAVGPNEFIKEAVTRIVISYGILTLILILFTVYVQKKSSEKVGLRECLLKSVFDSSLDGYLLIDLDGNINLCSSSAQKMLGYTSDDLIEVDIAALISDCLSSKCREYLDGCIARNDMEDISTTRNVDFIRKDGSLISVQLRVSEAYIDKQRLFLAVIQDQTKQNAGEQKLEEREELLQLVASSAFSAIIMVNGNGNISFWNKSAERIFGWMEHEALGSNIYSLVVPEGGNAVVIDEEKLFSSSKDENHSGRVLEITTINRNGTRFPVELSISSHQAGGSMNTIGIFNDISERKQIEKELRLRAEALLTSNEMLERARLSALSVMEDAELHRIEAEKAKVEAECAAQAKSDFLSNMSHEIRTPMNAIIGYSHLLAKTTLSSKQKDFVEHSKKSATHLLGIVNDILDFSKAEAGELHIENIEFDLNDIICGLSTDFSLRADQKGLKLFISVMDDVPTYLLGDPLRIREILSNLLNNALKFTEDGQIDLDCSVQKLKGDNVTLKFSVTDTGCGLTEEDQNKLFNSFTQADTSTTRKYDGLGLGLSICKQLVELMGGEIGCSGASGSGSTFWFTCSFVYNDELKMTIVGSDTIDDELEFPDIKKMSILLVEDNRINQLMMRDLLESHGASVTIAGNGQEAVDFFNSDNFNVILMDVQMPVLGGYDATRQIRAIESRQYSELSGADTVKRVRNRNTPIIGMTASSTEDDYTYAREAGMTDCVPKPIDTGHLFSTLEKWFHLSGKHIHNFELKNAVDSMNGQSECQSVLNINKALSRIRGNRDLYFKLLKSFENSNRDLITELRELNGNRDYEAMRVAIHKHKGVAGNLGAEALYNAAARIERAVKNGGEETLEKLLQEFEYEYGRVTRSIHDLTNDTEKKQPQIIKAVKERVSTQLQELYSSLKTDHGRAIRIFDELTPHLSETEVKLEFNQAQEAMDNFDMDTTAHKIKQIAQKLTINLQEIEHE